LLRSYGNAMSELMDDFDDKVLERKVRGESNRRIAKDLRTTEREVRNALDRLTRQADVRERLHARTVELALLDSMVAPYYEKMLEGNPEAGAILIRISERRSRLQSLDSPQEIALLMTNAKHQEPSTAAFERGLKWLERFKLLERDGKPEDVGERPGKSDDLSPTSDEGFALLCGEQADPAPESTSPVDPEPPDPNCP